MTSSARPRLSRNLPGTPAAPPVQIVHLGLGNFHRAHQAWYTSHAPDAAMWGIAAFTGRRADAAEALAPQDGLYTLITRNADGDTFDVIGSIARVHPASDHRAYLDYLSQPEVALVTITVTEAAYLRRSDGHLDVARDDVRSDVAALKTDATTPVVTLPARLTAGLLARRGSGAGPLTILSCDNLPENGAVTATVVRDLAELVDPTLLDWMDDHVDFATSMVDRITPATTDDDRDTVAAAQGYRDVSPVPTEPYSDWVIAGRFPNGRPAWDQAGAQLVNDVTPYEQRKLWLLNGSHSMLAYAGSVLGHETIYEAITDPRCRDWVETYWDEACRHLDLSQDALAAYRAALLDRFGNPRMLDVLSRIAADGSAKLVVRTVPTIVAERAGDRVPVGAATTVAAWVLHLRGAGAPVKDADAAAAQAAAADPDLATAIGKVLDYLRPGLGDDQELLDAVLTQAQLLQEGA